MPSIDYRDLVTQIVRDNPGIGSREVKAAFPDQNPNKFVKILYKLPKWGDVKRIKGKNGFQYYPVDYVEEKA